MPAFNAAELYFDVHCSYDNNNDDDDGDDDDDDDDDDDGDGDDDDDGVHVCHSVTLLVLNHYYPGFSPAAIVALEHYKK